MNELQIGQRVRRKTGEIGSVVSADKDPMQSAAPLSYTVKWDETTGPNPEGLVYPGELEPVQPMFLIKSGTRYEFYLEDPRQSGYKGAVEEVTLEGTDSMNDWPDGAECPEPCLGQSKTDSKHYRGFRSKKDCVKAGFQYVTHDFMEEGTWQEMRKK